MNKYPIEVGAIVVSKMGRDEGRSFAVIQEVDSDFVMLADGRLRTIDRGILEELGKWVSLNEEAVRAPRPTGIRIDGYDTDFILEGDGCFYLFMMDVPGSNVAPGGRIDRFAFDRQIRSVYWLDNGEALPYTQKDGIVQITAIPFPYGTHLTARVAKIVTE